MTAATATSPERSTPAGGDSSGRNSGLVGVDVGIAVAKAVEIGVAVEILRPRESAPDPERKEGETWRDVHPSMSVPHRRTQPWAFMA